MKILLTGMGAVSCLGNHMGAHRKAFSEGLSGIRLIGENTVALPPGRHAGLVRDLNGSRPKVERFIQYAIREAFESAGLGPKKNLPVFAGSVHGDLDSWLGARAHGADFGDGLWNLLGNSTDEYCAGHDLTVVSTACTASAAALGLAMEMLQSGETEIALVVGVESLTPFLFHGFDSLRSVAPENCRPFDRNRDGLVLGEGAAVLILETESHAARRYKKASIEVCGYGFSTDGVHLTAPDPTGQGAALALERALKAASFDGLPDFINAHGTGTRLNDRMECLALQRTFANKLPGIALTSTKPMTGHMCGATGAMEIISTAIGLEQGVVPPILGFSEPDEEFSAFDFVKGAARRGTYKTAISMNSGFGGTNTAVILRKGLE